MQRAGRVIGTSKFAKDLADPELRARAAWPEAAGSKIAPHTRAVSLVRGALIVEVNDYIWQRQLASLRPHLLKNLTKALGEALVTDIDFRPMPKRREPQRADHAHPPSAMSTLASEHVDDPVLDVLYRQSRRKGTA